MWVGCSTINIFSDFQHRVGHFFFWTSKVHGLIVLLYIYPYCRFHWLFSCLLYVSCELYDRQACFFYVYIFYIKPSAYQILGTQWIFNEWPGMRIGIGTQNKCLLITCCVPDRVRHLTYITYPNPHNNLCSRHYIINIGTERSPISEVQN